MKHLLEAKEEHLRREQEQLRREKEQPTVETEMREANAILEVLESGSKCGSKVSNGMNSYVEKAKIISGGLNPEAARFVPTQSEANPMQNTENVAVRPKHPERLQSESQNIHATNIPTVTTSAHDAHRSDAQQYQIRSSPDLLDIMQRQNEITSLLLEQNLASALPARNMLVFDGDPLHFKSFLRAFENCVEHKTTKCQ